MTQQIGNVPRRPLETRSEAIARWEANGWLVKSCAGCLEYYNTPSMPWDVFAPRHEASIGCESGRKPHCTCEACW